MKLKRTESHVEPLNPGHAVDEVQARAGVTADILDDQVNMLVITTNNSVQRPLKVGDA